MSSDDFCQNKLFRKFLSGLSLECQTVCKSYQQTTPLGRQPKSEHFKMVNGIINEWLCLADESILLMNLYNKNMLFSYKCI